jgi:tRNA pseudouridine55 synthase
VERTARQVTVHELRCDAFAGDLLDITVRVSKGTYIRVLAEDIGAALGCGGYLLALRRTAIDGLRVEDAVSLEHLKNLDVAERDKLLAPCDSLLGDLPECVLDQAGAARLRQGLNASVAVQDGPVRLYAPQHRFLGLGVARAGTVAPKRLLATGDGREQMQELLEETAHSRVE